MNIVKILLLIPPLIFNLSACQIFSADLSDTYEIDSHTLIDKVWSVSAQKFISQQTLQQKTLTHRVILLGETHDNARHHQLQAEFIRYLTQNARTPAVAFEMLNQNQQSMVNNFTADNYPAISNSSQSAHEITDLFAKKINWEKSGWPDWTYYRPVFYTTIKNQLAIIAANLDRKQVRKVIKQGSQTLEQQYLDILQKYQYDKDLKKELEQEIQSAHCDMLPEKMLSPMLLGQQTRDIAMTLAIKETMEKRQTQTILIAGSGHTRNDYGIPFYLRQENPQTSIISIAFLEVDKNKINPQNYSEAWTGNGQKLPFDYIWFTARATRDDQCEKMKMHMKKKNNE